ncbi:MAG: hypothetical protein LBD72_03355 [Puniceicoccales bacterium]|jgi:transketolase|nr:hypothetical protein [Puniceicoccales bacterium]
MDCDKNCSICFGCDITGFCGGLTPGDGETLAQLADFGRGFSRKLLPNLPIGRTCACLRAVLLGKFLRTAPDIPCWIDRDRFVVEANKLLAILPWSYLAGFPIQLDDIIGGAKNILKDFDFRPLGMELAMKPSLVRAVEVAILHKKMTTSLQRSGVPCLSKVLGLAGVIPNNNPMVAESLQLAADAELDNLILISEIDAADDSPCIPISELRAIGFSVEEIEKDDVQTVYKKLLHARINGQRQPKIIIVRNQSAQIFEISPATISDESTTADFFIPDTIHNYFALLNMRKNSDYDNWQYRFECAVDFHPEILQFVEGIRAH